MLKNTEKGIRKNSNKMKISNISSRSNLIIFFLVMMIFANIPGSKAAENALFWVRTDGSNTCTGQNNVSFSLDPVNCAWKTIAKASSTITAGQTVRIQSGTYSENNI